MTMMKILSTRSAGRENSSTEGEIAMGKHNFTKDVVCPYYKYEAPQMIYCEGVDDNTALHLAFDAKDRMKGYIKARCCNRWKECLIAQMLNRKYDYE